MVDRDATKHAAGGHLIKERDERLALRPDQKTRLMHTRIGEAPKRMLAIGDKVRGRDNLIGFGEDGVAKRTTALSKKDKRHRG